MRRRGLTGPYKGDVTVTASVDRGTARFEKLTLYVDGVEVDSQEFGGPASPRPQMSARAETTPRWLAAQQDDRVHAGVQLG